MTSRTGTTVGTPEPPEEPLSGRARRRHGVQVTSAAAVALGLALAGGSVAGATTSANRSPSKAAGSAPPVGRPPGGGSPPVAVGTVETVGTGTFAVLTAGGKKVTVEVSSTTTYRDRGVSNPSFADVTVGQHVAVFGSDSSNRVMATTVAIGAPPKGAPPNGAPPKGAPPNGAPPNGARPKGPGGKPSGTSSTPPEGAPTS
jgi:hypothetical protein